MYRIPPREDSKDSLWRGWGGGGVHDVSIFMMAVFKLILISVHIWYTMVVSDIYGVDDHKPSILQ